MCKRYQIPGKRNLNTKNGHCNGLNYVVVIAKEHVIKIMAINGFNLGGKFSILKSLSSTHLEHYHLP